MSRRVLAELAVLALWVVGGTFGLLALVPRVDGAALAAPTDEQRELVEDLNLYRATRGLSAMQFDGRLSALLYANAEEGLRGMDLLEHQWTLCQTADWVTVTAPAGESLLMALNGEPALYVGRIVLGTAYTHVGVFAQPNRFGHGRTYRLLLCRLRETSATT